MKRIALMAAALLGSLALGVVAASGALSINRSHGPDTYELGDFTIQYPYVDPTGEQHEGVAGVTYSATWRAAYPGEVPCTIALTGDQGQLVGERDFILSSAMPSAPAEGSFRPVSVSGRPEAATGSCDSVTGPTGSGYQFGPAEVSGGDEKGTADLTFPVEWVGSEFPGDRTCTITVLSDVGATTEEQVGIFIGKPSSEFHWTVPVPAAHIASTAIECAPPSRNDA